MLPHSNYTMRSLSKLRKASRSKTCRSKCYRIPSTSRSVSCGGNLKFFTNITSLDTIIFILFCVAGIVGCHPKFKLIFIHACALCKSAWSTVRCFIRRLFIVSASLMLFVASQCSSEFLHCFDVNRCHRSSVPTPPHWWELFPVPCFFLHFLPFPGVKYIRRFKRYSIRFVAPRKGRLRMSSGGGALSLIGSSVPFVLSFPIGNKSTNDG